MKPPVELKNRYFILRHGESESNVLGINVTDPAVGLEQYGLTDKGRQQVERSLKAFPKTKQPIQIFTSDFRRARETAEIARRILGAGAPVIEREELRERLAGEFDGKSSASFTDIYAHDAQSAESLPFGVESTAELASRWATLFSNLEAIYSGETILLVSHGDPLSVLQAWIEGDDLRHHRQHPIGTGELRRLN
ncbi:histidine phosphatase family protein [Patescibacteria group bacterium]|nr:histidine phosphatase family protein [Patescibacteria group bacterium]